MPNKLRVVLVGCGPIAERHLMSWEAVPKVEVVALCDRHPEHFDYLTAKFGSKRTFTDYTRLLEEIDFEIADIATRPYSHKGLVFKSAEAGKHIMCQKPFAPTLKEAQEMIKICEDNEVRFMICENWRWFIWFQVIKDILRSGKIGEVKYAHMTSHGWFTIPKGENPPAVLNHTQTYLKDMRHLAVYESGIHYIDVFRYLFGDANSVYAHMGKMSSDIAGEDFALITLKFSEMHGSIDISWCSRESQEERKSEYLLIEGSEGTIILDQKGRIQIVRGDGKTDFPEYNYKEETKLKTHFRLHKHFVDGILEGKPFQTDAKDNIKTLEIVLKSYESAQENKVIILQKDKLLGCQE